MRQIQRFFFLSILAFDASRAYTGEGTTYGLTNPSGGNCNFMDYPQAARTNFVAINKVQWNSSMSCGRCAQVTCTDPLCAGRSKESEIVYVIDQCPGCNDGDLDLSPTVFQAITGMEPSRVAISWSFVTCPNLDKITYCLKEGSTSFWAAVQPTHTAVGVDSVMINDLPTSMVESCFYFLLDGNSTVKPDLANLKITMTSVLGETIEDVLSFTNDNCVEGKSQFTRGESSNVSMISEVHTEALDNATSTLITTSIVSAPSLRTNKSSATTEAPTIVPKAIWMAASTSGTAIPIRSTTSPASDDIEPSVRFFTTRSNDLATGPVIVLSVLVVLGCLLVVVFFFVYIIYKKKKRLDERLEQDKLAISGRDSSESDYSANVAIYEQMPSSNTAAKIPRTTLSFSNQRQFCLINK